MDRPSDPNGGPGPATRTLRLVDLAALVVGYGMASLLVRAFWPALGSPSPAVWAVLAFEFTWLGLAMSGPVVLAIGRRPEGPDDEPPARTWAETAWLIIGYYWIGMTILVVPVRVARTRLVDTAILGLFPFLAALLLRFFGPRSPASRDGTRDWTHRASVGLLSTWPLAWIALILLGKTLM